MAELKIKYYENRYKKSSGRIFAIINWDIIFLKKLADTFGIDGSFSYNDLSTIFNNIMNSTAVCQKVLYFYHKGWFYRQRVHRDVEKKQYMGRGSYFVFSFSDYAKNIINNINGDTKKQIEEDYQKIIDEINERRLIYV